MTTSTIIDRLNYFGQEIKALFEICLDIDTPETTRIILRKELSEIKLELDKMISEIE